MEGMPRHDLICELSTKQLGWGGSGEGLTMCPPSAALPVWDPAIRQAHLQMVLFSGMISEENVG